MFLSKLKAKFAAWKEKRFLKKRGCETREQYERNYDPKIFHAAQTIPHFYHGYTKVVPILYPHYAYEELYDFGPGGLVHGYDQIINWCKEHCNGKFRPDVHRVLKDSTNDFYWFNDLGGSDIIFFAFTKEEDAIMFSLTWL